jgi:hypothetical protein
MTELSNVLREVLRALGVEEWQKAGLGRPARDASAEHGDHHGARHPVEYERA